MKKIMILWVVLGMLPFFTMAGDLRFPAWFSDHMVLQRDKAIPVWGWAKAGEKVTVKLGDEMQVDEADQNGRWSVSFSPRPAGGPVVLSAETDSKIEISDVLIGDVWVISGQSNMNIPVRSADDAEEAVRLGNDPLLRYVRITERPAYFPKTDAAAEWVVSSPDEVPRFSCVGYWFGRTLRDALGDVPVGLIHSAVGSSCAEAWISQADLRNNSDFAGYAETLDELGEKYPEMKTDMKKIGKEWTAVRLAKNKANVAFVKGEIDQRPDLPDVPYPRQLPSLMYNGMIHPLVPFAIRGVIWWQGVSNARPVEKALEYRELFPYLIQCWRSEWGQGDFPFIFAEEPTWKWEITKPGLMLIREAQLMSFRRVPNTAVVVTSDLRHEADPKLIHFPEKPPVGRRMAAAALSVEYGRPTPYCGPLFDPQKTRVEEDAIRIGFTHVGSGLTARDGRLGDFVIAGEDQKFVEAQAEIDSDTVVVRADSVRDPKAVRYDWTDWAGATLMNKEGLPASPFRTDHWIIGEN